MKIDIEFMKYPITTSFYKTDMVLVIKSLSAVLSVGDVPKRPLSRLVRHLVGEAPSRSVRSPVVQ